MYVWAIMFVCALWDIKALCAKMVGTNNSENFNIFHLVSTPALEDLFILSQGQIQDFWKGGSYL